MVIDLMVITGLIAGWTAAWINWLFNGELRQFVVSKFPRRWIGDTDRTDIAFMDKEEFMRFVCTTAGMPEFLRGILSCPLCMSAHVAGTGAIMGARSIYIVTDGRWETIPLVWAAAAVIGFLSIKKHL